jgi:hypothetical protein
MHRTKNIEYTYFENFIIRVPSHHFSQEDFFKLNPEGVLDLFKTDAFFREAVFVASQVLYNEVIKSIGKGNIENKLILSLTKYYIRCKTRCTPFGLFSSSTSGKIGHETNVLLKNLDSYKKHTRLDMELVSKLTGYFSSLPNIQKQIKIFPNNTLFRISNFYSFIESEIMSNKKTYFKSTTDYSEHLESLLEFCEEGRFLNEIVQFLVQLDFEKEESIEYVESLIENQILSSDLEISTLDPDPFKTLAYKLDTLNREKDSSIDYFISQSKDLINYYSINTASRSTIGNMAESAAIFAFAEHDVHNIFQTDLELTTLENTLSEKTATKITKAIKIIESFTSYSENDVLEDFKNRFQKKYEAEEIPLLLILDEDFGLGYPYLEDKLITPLLDNIKFPVTKVDNKNTKWDKKDTLLAQKLSDFFIKNTNNREIGIVITDEDLNSIEDKNNKDLHNTLSAMVEIYRDEENREKIYVPGFIASAAKLLGRFSSFDSDIKNIIHDIVKKEEEYLDENTIFAEIVHLPESREGNVILRPQLTDYEIPILSRSLLPKEQQIELKDLVLSIREDKLVLRSLKLNKKIIPRLTSAHYSGHPKNLSFYKFLADFQYQQIPKNIYFDWGIMGVDFKYLPRVSYKDLILSKAYWNITEKEIKYLISICKDENFLKRIKQWRIENNIPSVVVIKDTDNKLYIDFDNKLFVELFLNTIKNSSKIVLEEVLFSDKNVFVKNQDGKYFTNEFIINFYKKRV